MRTLILVLALTIPALAQVKTLEPVRIALTVEDSPDASDFNKQLRRELGKLRRVAFTSERVDFDVFATSGPIVTGEKTVGYAVAVAVVRGDGRIGVLLVTEQSMEAAARRTARRIDEEFFEKR